MERGVCEHDGFGTNDSGKGQFAVGKNPAVGGFESAAVFQPAFENLPSPGREVSGNDFGAEQTPLFIDDKNESVSGSWIIDFYGGGHFHSGRQVTEPA